MHAEEREEMSKVRRTQKCTSDIKGYFASVNDPVPSITISSSTFFLLIPLIYSQGQAERQHAIWRVWRLVQGLQSQQVRQRYLFFGWIAVRLFFSYVLCLCPALQWTPPSGTWELCTVDRASLRLLKPWKNALWDLASRFAGLPMNWQCLVLHAFNFPGFSYIYWLSRPQNLMIFLSPFFCISVDPEQHSKWFTFKW